VRGLLLTHRGARAKARRKPDPPQPPVNRDFMWAFVGVTHTRSHAGCPLGKIAVSFGVGMSAVPTIPENRDHRDRKSLPTHAGRRSSVRWRFDENIAALPRTCEARGARDSWTYLTIGSLTRVDCGNSQRYFRDLYGSRFLSATVGQPHIAYTRGMSASRSLVKSRVVSWRNPLGR
jgi:hypothetical protein